MSAHPARELLRRTIWARRMPRGGRLELRDDWLEAGARAPTRRVWCRSAVPMQTPVAGYATRAGFGLMLAGP